MLLKVLAGALVVNIVVIYSVWENKIDRTFLAICALFQLFGVIGVFMKERSSAQSLLLKTSHISLVIALLLSPLVAQTNILLSYSIFIVLMILATRFISMSRGDEECVFPNMRIMRITKELSPKYSGVIIVETFRRLGTVRSYVYIIHDWG